MPGTQKLDRALTLTQATAINMIDMVGIGPFVTLPLIVGLMEGPAALLPWMLGALLAFADGMVWAELGARWPEAGGSYVFLGRLYQGGFWGKLIPFLFLWQTTLQAPLVIASGAIGFSNYFAYLAPLGVWGHKLVAGGLVALLVALLYRNISSIGRISVILWAITGGTFVWLVVSGIPAFRQEGLAHWASIFGDPHRLVGAATGKATLKAVYAYLGYYNVCHLGGEIKNPQRNIPRSILLSIAGIVVLYLLMQIMILGVLPWPRIAGSEYVVSVYFEQVYHSHRVGQLATALILIIALASLFSAILGYSRIPYAAALKGDFFPVFARLHPKYHFPHVSLLLIGGLGFVFALLFRLSDVISALLMMRILIQFVTQTVGLLLWHYRLPADERPFRMPLFPLPALVSICIWLFIFFSNEVVFRWGALGIILSGLVAFGVMEARERRLQA